MKHINLYYDWFGPYGPIGNGLSPEQIYGSDKNTHTTNVRRLPGLRWHLHQNNVNCSTHSIHHFYENSQNDKLHIYCIEPISFRDYVEDNPILHISEVALDYVRTYNLKILVFFPTEGFCLDDMDFLTPLSDGAVKIGLSSEDIHFIFGDLNFNQNYKTRKFGNDYKVTSFDFFQSDYRDQVYSKWFGEYKECAKKRQQEYIDPNDLIVRNKLRPKKFLSLNGSLRPHRILAISEMKRRNIIQHGKVSLLGRHGDRYNIDNLYWLDSLLDNKPKNNQIKEFLFKYLQDWTPLQLDIDTDELTKDDRQQDKMLYLDTYFSFVTETEIVSFNLFITEKTFKPIVNLHPFLLMGNKGILQYLRDEGYHTFPAMFNESYDDEPDPRKRFTLVMDELDNFSKLPQNQLHELYQQCWPSLVHNQKLFLSKSHKERYEKLFTSIYGD